MTDVSIPEGSVDKFLGIFSKYLAVLLEGGLAKECPVDNGDLRNSIDVSVVDGKLLVKMHEYGVYVEYGTLPHVIEAKNAKALHWKSGGKDVFAKRVNHPGTAPNPFIRRTFFSKFNSFVEQAATIAEREVNLI